MARTLYIIDGHAQIYRAFYADDPHKSGISRMNSPAGDPTGTIHMFFAMLINFLADRLGPDDLVAMAIDGPRSELKRTAAFPQYKGTRSVMPDTFHSQALRIVDIVRTMGIPVLRAPGYEADDIMATAAAKFAADDLKIVLVSRDKDLDQLVNDNVVLYDPMKDETFDAAAIEENKGYPPAKAVEVQTLTGDTSDNIPGVPGVGPKTAVKLIAKYGTAEEVIAHAHEQTPKLKENLLAAKDTIAMSRQLVTLDVDVPMQLDLDAMRFADSRGQIAANVHDILTELGLRKLLEQINKKLTGGATAAATAKSDSTTDSAKGAAADDSNSAAAHTLFAETTAADLECICVDTPEALDDLVSQLASVKRMAVDTETTSIRPMSAELVGISLSWQPGKGYYIPVRGPLLGSPTLSVDFVRERMAGILADESIEKIGQNLKYDMLVLQNAGMPLAGKMFDTMLAAYVLDSTRRSYKLDTLAEEMLGHKCTPIQDVIGKGRNQITMDTAPIEVVTPYAVEDAEVTLRLADVLAEQLPAGELAELFANVEMPLMRVLCEMEHEGIILDVEHLRRMETELSKQIDVLHDKVIAAAGRQFNPDSPKQLAQVLFEDLGLTVIKKGKSGPSTDSSVLEELATEHELPGLILEYRQLAKLLSTYVKSLVECVNRRTGRIHTSFRQNGTVTGRLSSSDPNLQNIPVRTEEGRKIRSAFVAPEGHLLLAADYSQVELRVLAHLCQDKTLLDAFANDQDIHRIVAAEVFSVPLDEVTPEQRSRAKTVNFGIVYGQTGHGLARTLGISRGEAGEFIKKYHMRFPCIHDFLQSCIEQAKERGYVETILHRRRSIPDIDSRNHAARQQAERLALNSVVQGSAADLIKLAMINIARRIKSENRPSKMLLQIHDELVFEVPADAVEAEREMICAEMSSAVKLSVPLKVDTGTGKNWKEAK